ncbi:hypothetical protein ACFOEQ_22320 [Chryseobacterium arachidis]|uniref:hypothetical protein n=1 Tax=Chryseobacterium arachidis TaxID=1416778 RepID=UPI00361DD945
METRDWRNGELINYTALNNLNDTIKTTKRDFYTVGAPNASINYQQDRNIKMIFSSLVSPIDYISGGTPLRNEYSGASMLEPNVEINDIFPSYIGVNTTVSPGPFPIFVRHNDAFLLKKEETTDYFTDGRKKSRKTEYFYNDSLYPTKLTSTRESFSGENVELNTTFKYAYEKGNQLMINRNMLNIPLENTTTQTINGITKNLEKSETIYPTSLPTTQTGNLVLPLSEQSYDKLNNNASTDVSYDKYDEKGNILQYTTKDGIPVSIVWGYNKTQPIAKIEGISYGDLTVGISIAGIVSASNDDATDPTKEGLLLDALNSFRKESALLGKKITTYTYDPLIGVTSITPPSGIRQTFVYDAANRLKETDIRGKQFRNLYQ